MSGSNRRRFPRVRTSSGVAALLQIGGATTSVVIDNISLGGVFLRSARPMSSGTRVSMKIVRPGMRIALTLTGEVVGVLSNAEAQKNGVTPGMRIKFDAVEEGRRERLAALLIELGLPEHQHVTPEAADDPFAQKATERLRGPKIPAAFSTQKIQNAVETLPEQPRKTPPEGNPFTAPASEWERKVAEGEPAVPVEANVVEVTLEPEPEGEVDRLMNHVRGLLLQMSQKEQRIEALEAENRELKARIYDLEHK